MGIMDLKIKLLTGETHSLHVSADTTVGDLKRLIEQHFKVPTSEQKLSVSNGQSISLSNDSKTVRECGLKSGSTVILLIMKPEEPAFIQVFLKNEKGQNKTYDVYPGETVTQFKFKVYNMEKVPVDQQRLIHEGKQLEDGRKLEDYGIRSGSTIFLLLRLRGG